MEEIIIEYSIFIKDFEDKIIKKYKLENNPWFSAGKLFDKKGEVDGYNYSYHGSGCTLEKDGIVCEYDIAPLNGKNIKFSLWKISEFIRTHPEYRKLEYETDYIENELSKLIQKKIVSWLELDGYVFKIYQIENI